MSAPWKIILGIAGAVLGASGIAYALSKRKIGGGDMPTKTSVAGDVAFVNGLQAAAGKMPGNVLTAARKWAEKRGLALGDVMATILLESRGNPKAHAKTAKEDSRGLMQVNVAAHAATLKSLGYTADDLFDPDHGVELGTLVLAASRKTVQDLVKASRVEQVWPIDVLARLRYAGPAYVDKMLRTAKQKSDTAHPFKNAETYIAHWQDAKRVATERGWE